LTDKLSSIPSV